MALVIVDMNEFLLVVAAVVAAGTTRAVGTGTAVATHGATSAIATGTGTAVAAVAVATAIARTTVAATLATLVVTLGLLLQGTHRQAELAGLLVNLDKLDGDLVALVQTAGLHVGEAVPADFADVHKEG